MIKLLRSTQQLQILKTYWYKQVGLAGASVPPPCKCCGEENHSYAKTPATQTSNDSDILLSEIVT